MKLFGDSTLQDILFLFIAVVSSFILYIGGLGFYSDDWSTLAIFALSPSDSALSYMQAYPFADFRMRPLQIVYYAALFQIFGMNPLGYHVVNVCVFTAIAILIYLILKQLGLPRIISLCVALVYIMLPNYSSVRFWYAVFAASASMMFYLVSLYTGLRALSGSQKRWAWEITSILGLLISSLMYEVVMPMYIFNVFLYLIRSKNNKKRTFLFISSTLLLLIGIFAYKYSVTTRYGDGPFQGLGYYIGYLIWIVKSVSMIHWGKFGIALPRTLWYVISTHGNAINLSATAVFGVFTYLYLSRIISDRKFVKPDILLLKQLMITGIILFWLGFSIFYVNNNIGFSPTGIANRIAIVASAGFALFLVSFIGFISRYFKSTYAYSILFCSLITILASGGFLINNVLAIYWVSAYPKEKTIISNIKKNIQTFPNGKTLFLDGICPYDGPAIIFESNWDLAGALQVEYGNPKIKAAVISRIFKVTDTGFSTTLYGKTSEYKYSESFIYNIQNKKMYTFNDKIEAQKYFSEINKDYSNGCPPGGEGNGVTVF